MSQQPLCPKCSATLKDDYGMVECPSCGSFVFIDMDGLAHISNEENSEPTPLTNVGEFSFPEFPPAENEEAFEDRSASSESEVSPFEMSPSEFSAESQPVDGTYDPVSEPVEGGDFSMDNLLGFSAPSAEASDFGGGEEAFGMPGDPLGLNEYANSEMSQAKDGLLSFKILISGIDSKEMRESLRSALEDQRFGWNPNELISLISKGVLQIDNVSSVKAVILINRIKRMPVTIRWEQYAITKMDSNQS